MTLLHKRWLTALWLLFIGGFALLHALHLSADFPNHTPWFSDWAKFTDEGWYGNAAIRAHLYSNWYVAGDFTPAPALPVLPFLEWLLFFVTGVSVEAARGLAVGFFFLNLLLSYLLLRTRGSRWTALLGVTLIVTSPFLYCFSRLAILEPLQITFLLAALNLAVRLPRLRRPLAASVLIGLLFTLMMLTKTTAVFLLPALGWAIVASLWPDRKLALRSALIATGSFAASFGLWMALVIRMGLFADFKYLFFVNRYAKPKEFYWPLVSLWWSFHGGLWIDHILIPLAGVVVLAGATLFCRSIFSEGCQCALARLVLMPEFGASLLAIAGSVFFMTIQNHIQPRYYAVPAFFCFMILAMGAAALLKEASGIWPQWIASAGLAVIALATAFNGLQILNYAAHPEYTYVDAARRLTQYIDAHPNGNRLLLSTSGDQITLLTHLPSVCDEFGMQKLDRKLARYQPGWYAAWNDIDPATLGAIHTRYSLEQVASFQALDDPNRNILVLFKLHPLANGQVRQPQKQNLQLLLPDDQVDIEVD
ncbi:MAG: glycosyltransferase family 39 protein [Terracidiphilus sp.]